MVHSSVRRLACLAAAVWGLVVALPASAQGKDPLLASLLTSLQNARAQQVDVLAPTGFATAAEAYNAANEDAEKGRNPERIRKRLNEGVSALQAAEKAAASARQLLSGVVKAREDAVTANAPKLAQEQWQKGADRFNEAMVANERGDTRNAQRRSAEAEVLLRDAELIAIKGGVLNEARALIAKADEARVEKFAPRSLQAAKRHLAEAEQEIQRNRYDMTLPRTMAAEARYEARHALYLARLIDEVQERKDAGLEALILSWEEPLKRIAAEMELPARFDEGMQPVTKELLEQTYQQRQQLTRLKQELEDREQQVAAMNSQLQRLEARLGGVSEERIQLQRRVDAQETLRANVAKVESSFAPDEARVYRQGEDVVMSLLGIKFPSGRSTIDAASSSLMLKVQAALSLFPGASVSVEGHTDANGSDSTNLILSQDRADAVKQYLVNNFRLNPEKVTSIGYGEARPVSTNETTEGRARNRRIDLVIHLAAR
jgi:OmpA-OmpF porin, OOP family